MKDSHRIKIDGHDWPGFFEPRRKNKFPAQAQVAA
jgi:hypothetical protein